MVRQRLLKELVAGFMVAAVAVGCGSPAPKPGAPVTDAAAGDPALVPSTQGAASKGPVGPGAGAGALDGNVPNTGLNIENPGQTPQ